VRVTLLAAAAVAVAFLGAGSAARAADPVLTADVGIDDSFAIGITDPGGAPVKHLDPGTYTLLIHDHSSFHNFHFSGPGVDVASDVDFVGDRTFTVTLTDGTYFFQCDPHAGQMRGKFTVGAVTEPAPAAPPTRLTAGLGPGKAFSLRPAAGLSAGKAIVTVNDRSAADGFRLGGPGVSKSTGVKFRGKVTWTVTLRAGTYTFGSSRNAKLRRSFTVSA
jgi:plastocyanin